MHSKPVQRIGVAAVILVLCAVLTGAQAEGTQAPATMDAFPVIAAIVLVLAAVLIVPLVRSSDLLRDSEPKDIAGLKNVAGDDLRRPYSLAMSQMIWWFLIILLSYLYIFFFYKHDPNILTGQTLILMGIGTGTAIGAALIDQNKKNTNTLAAFNALQKQINDLRLQGMSDVQLKPQLDQRDGLARQLASESFLKDVLTDVNGISLHRVQQLVWTVLLGLIFLYLVLAKHELPDFSNVMLGALGISGATYLGFKIPEQAN